MNWIKFILFSAVFIGCTSNRGMTKKIFHPLIDGKINQEEWSNSKVINFQDKYELLFKQDEQYYYLAIKNKTETPFYIDLFFLIDESLFNIHSSSQLGERKLVGTEWDDSIPITNWGYINGWSSNSVLFDRRKFKRLKEEGFEGNLHLETVVPYDGFEFQFAKSIWDLDSSKMRIEMRDMFGLKGFEETIYPKESDRHAFADWHVVDFD